jgi:hypothetical protein
MVLAGESRDRLKRVEPHQRDELDFRPALPPQQLDSSKTCDLARQDAWENLRFSRSS